MRKMRHEFPVKRTDTITRANVKAAMKRKPDKLTTGYDVAAYLMGENAVKARHVRKATSLMV